MAITNLNQENGSSNAKSSPSFGTDPASGQQPQPWSFHTANLLGSPVAAGIGGEYMIQFRQALANVFKDIAPSVEVRILTLNRQNTPSLRFSALIVACRIPDTSSNVVAFHTLILEATGEKLQPVMRNVDNQQTRITLVTSDAYDEVLRTLAFDAVSESSPGATIIAAEGEVIPGHVQPADKETIENIARNSAMACYSEISIAVGGFNPLNLATVERDCRFNIDVAFGNNQVNDIVGMPQRASAVITYNSVRKGNASNWNVDTINVPDNYARVCELTGFLNPIWAPLAPPNMYGAGIYGAYQNQPMPTQKFAAEFVITSVSTEYASSPAAVLLAVSSVLAVVDNDTWAQGLLPRGGQRSGQVDLNDIGVLNITANLANEKEHGDFGTPVNTSEMRNEPSEASRYISALFQPGVAVSMDCPEAGPSSWYTSVFALAANGSPEAAARIYDAAEELTNGNFAKYFKRSDRIFSNSTRVPLGYYLQGDRKMDIRTIDYIAIAALFANNPQMIHEYSNTFVPRQGVSPIRNLSIRENMIMLALNDQAVITSYAARVTFSDAFVTALSSAIADCSLLVSVNTPLTADQLRSGVAAPDFISKSLTRGTHTFNGMSGGSWTPPNYMGNAFRRGR